MRFGTFLGIACMGVAMVASLPAKADLIGTGSNTVDPVFYIGDKLPGETEDEGTQTLANPLTYSFGGSSETSLQFTDTQVTLTDGFGDPYCNPVSATPCAKQLVGFEFFFSSGVDITGVSVGAPTSPDFHPVALSLVTPQDVLVNLTDLDPAAGDVLTLDFSFTPIGTGGGPTDTPEPMSAALLGVGLVGLLVLRSRRSMPLGRHA